MVLIFCGLVGLLTGWLAGKRMGGFGYGPLIDSVMGMAGGLIGGFAAGSTQWGQVYFWVVPVLGAVVGAMLAAGLVGLASGKSRFA